MSSEQRPGRPIRGLEDLLDAHRDTTVEEHLAQAAEDRERARKRTERKRDARTILVGFLGWLAAAVALGVGWLLWHGGKTILPHLGR